MSDPRRLLNGSENPLVSRLLVAGTEEAPSDFALRRALQLGVAGAGLLGAAEGVAHGSGALPAAGAASGAAAPGAIAGAGSTGAAAGSSGVAQAAASVSLAKWVGVGLVGLASATSVPAVVRWVEHTESPAPVSKRSATAPVPPPEPVLPVPAPSLVPPPRAPAASAARRAVPALRAADSATLAAEMAMLERARASLAEGHAGRALAELGRYEASFPSPQLRLEALVLRMEALVQSGRLQAARGVAREILSQRAAAPHAARARELLRQAEVP